jgi:hypothetical protein
MLSLAMCAPEGALFPSSFTIKGPGQFEFVASGTWIYPANTAAGEAARLTWLRAYLSQHQICSAGYRIIERTPQPLTGSPKASLDAQSIRSFKYLGLCEPWS